VTERVEICVALYQVATSGVFNRDNFFSGFHRNCAATLLGGMVYLLVLADWAKHLKRFVQVLEAERSARQAIKRVCSVCGIMVSDGRCPMEIRCRVMSGGLSGRFY